MKKIKIFVMTLLLLCAFGCENNALKNEVEKDNTETKEREYYGYQDVSYSWAYEVNDYTKVIDKATKILKIKVLDIQDGTFEFSSGTSALPLSPIKVEVLEVLYGQNDDININTIYKQGGDVTVKQMRDFFPIEKIQKMGLDKLSDEEAEKKYISYNSTMSSVELEKGEIYVVTLKDWNSDGITFITPSGYGVFKLNEISTLGLNSGETYTNTITNKIVDINAFRK